MSDTDENGEMGGNPMFFLAGLYLLVVFIAVVAKQIFG